MKISFRRCSKKGKKDDIKYGLLFCKKYCEYCEKFVDDFGVAKYFCVYFCGSQETIPDGYYHGGRKMIGESAEYQGKWLGNNVAQCWTCKNCVGQQRLLYDHKTKSVDLPECKVADCYMEYVIRVPCDRYEHDSRKALNLLCKEDN